MNNTKIIYLIGINFLSFLLFGIDKYKAIKNQYRIPEKKLLLISMIGGSIGSILGMSIFHHKVKKLKFTIIIPLILLIQIILLLKKY